tara:strand:+ start:316 stop:732 length:417 start_codon:yes stop_codon:yes gene_type:complete
MKCDVYVSMVGDLFHIGHLNILEYASRLGDITVGLLTDEAVKTYKRSPIVSYEDRKTIVSAIRYVDSVVPQETHSYRPNILKYRPRVLVHGDDWKKGVQQDVRNEVVKTLEEVGGTLIEVPYTKGISTTKLIDKVRCT